MVMFTAEQLGEVLSLVLETVGEHVPGSPSPTDCYKEAEAVLRYFGLTNHYRLKFNDVKDVIFVEVTPL